MGKSYWREFKKSVQDFYAPLNKEELYNKGLELYNKPKSDDDYIKALQYLQSAMILGYNKACEKAAEFCTKDPLNINNKKLGTLLNNIFINRMEGPPYDKMTFRISTRALPTAARNDIKTPNGYLSSLNA
ncbi:hypothetical protein [Rickettsia endosymbiont of Orchestes rusci]|uniref:hypothetical protein n=1 Tax=Rickettsia endosymbiont of Orchestes rusci TaxID=3066250 RepID=UPI00313D6620